MAINDREFGELSQRVQQLEITMKEVRSDVREGNKTSDQILAKIDRAEGGYRALLGIAAIAGGIASGVTALALKMFPFLIGKT